MKRLVTFLLAWCLTATAAAQPTATFSDDFDLTAPSELMVDSVRGIWFPMDEARALLADVRELDVLRRQTELDERLLARHGEMERILERRVTLLTDARDVANQARLEALARAREAEEKLDAWYRHPILWLAVGFVLAGAAGVALVVMGE